MEIAAYCLGGEAICQPNQVMGFRKVKLGRSVSHAAAVAVSVNTGGRTREREYLLLRVISVVWGRIGQFRDRKERQRRGS